MQESEIIIKLLEQLQRKSEEIALLRRRISALESEIAILKHSKNSKNSSTPPSHDPFRLKKTASLREKSGKKQGGQAGHEGNTLIFSEKPDAVIAHKSDYCSVCGRDLSGIEAIFAGKRQVIDIPPVVPIITEHQVFSRQYSCGHCQRGDYPSEAHSSVCYGNNLLGLTAYFHSRQYLPFDRMRELYRDVFGLEVSCGSLVNMVQRFASKVGDIYEEIRSRISKSPVVEGDETGVCVGGKNRWA